MTLDGYCQGVDQPVICKSDKHVTKCSRVILHAAMCARFRVRLHYALMNAILHTSL